MNLAQRFVRRLRPLICFSLLGLVLVQGPALAQAPLFDSPFFTVEMPYLDLAIADVNNDGMDDCVSLRNPGELCVYLNRGQRVFEPLSPVATESSVQLKCLDLDADGRLDLVIGGSHGVTTLLGNGDGTFRIGSVLPGTMSRFACGDVNRDGFADIVVQRTSSLSVHLAVQGGYDVPYEVPSPAGIPFVADFDGDFWPDLAIAITNAGVPPRVDLYPGDGHGGLSATPRTSLIYGAGNALDAVLCHVNFDGIPDIVLRFDGPEFNFEATGFVRVLQGQYLGPFTVLNGITGPSPTFARPSDTMNDGPPSPPQTTAATLGVLCIGAADIDANGRIELLMTNKDPNTRELHSTIRFFDGHSQQFDQVAYRRIAVADLDADGMPDLVGLGDWVLYVQPGNSALGVGHGWVTEIPTAMVGTVRESGNGGVVADFNADGHVDVACEVGGYVGLAAGRADGSFATPILMSPAIPMRSRLIAGDVNGDGKLDLVTDHGGVWLGDDAFHFSSAGGPGGVATDIAAADFNGDGHLDIVLTGSPSVCYQGRGDGQFDAVWNIYTNDMCRVADPDRDGHPDLYIGSYFARGIGDGRFETPISTGVNWKGIDDISGDGIADVVTNEGDVMLGTGDGRWTAWASIAPVAGAAYPLTVADFDGDGDRDIAAHGAYGFNTINLYLNDANQRFLPAGKYGAAPWNSSITEIVAVDVTGDGQLDLIGISRGSYYTGSTAPRGPGAITTLINVAPAYPTQVLLSRTLASWRQNHVELSWLVADVSFEGGIERRTQQTGWARVERARADGSGRITFEDSDVRPGTRYGYRLVGLLQGKSVEDEVWIDVPATQGFRLRAKSNPSHGAMDLLVDVPPAGEARLELFDIAGRVVYGQRIHGLAPGLHTVRAGSLMNLPKGVYTARLVAGKRQEVIRVMLLE